MYVFLLRTSQVVFRTSFHPTLDIFFLIKRFIINPNI